MRYPEKCTTIIDVTKPPYCADNTGKTDCTAVLCKILDDLLLREAEGIRETAQKMEALPTDEKGFAYIGFEDRKYIYRGKSEINVIFPEVTPPAKIIYFPAGTYLVSDTVSYTVENVRNIFHSQPFYQPTRGIHFLGESAETVTIRLKDECSGFEKGKSKPVIAYIKMEREDWRREITNIAQMNTFADLTVDCGRGNPGAVGLVFVSSNSGRIENSRFLSDGSECAIQTALGSEGVAENIEIQGFEYGIQNTDSSPLIWQDVKMRNIQKTGVVAGGRTILFGVSCDGAPLVEFAPGFDVCFAENCTPTPDAECGQNTLLVRNGKEVCVYGRNTSLPFGSDNWKMQLTMPEFPKNDRPPQDRWVYVDDFGAVGDGVTDSTEAIQRAMNSGAEVIYFGSGHYLVDGTISVPATVRVVDFLFCDFFAGENLRQMKDGALFTVKEDSPNLLSFENLYTFEQFYGYFHLICHACQREILCKDLHTQTAAMYFNTVPGGRVWFDNCACTTGTYSLDAILHRERMEPEFCSVIPFEFHGQWVRARNLNPERADVEVLNDASEFLAYGLKTEGPGTMLKTINGGHSEVCVLNAAIGKTGADNALITSKDSGVGIYFLRTVGFAPELLYEKMIEETDANGTRILLPREILGTEPQENAHTVIAYRSEGLLKISNVTITHHSIEKYRIVYAENAEKKASESIRMGEMILKSDFDRLTAEKIRDLIFHTTGKMLKVVCDSETATEFEITVGKTNRCNETLLPNTYQIKTVGSRLSVCGSDYGVTWHAAEQLKGILSEQKDFNFEADFCREGNFKLKRIGCLGDSITFGWNEEYYNFDYLTYPKQLGYLLWKDATVTNYSKGGVTMRMDDRYAYVKSEEYQACLNDAKDLDIATVMLGTNDGRYINDVDWTQPYEEMFLNSALKITSDLRERNPKIKVLFLSSPENYERADSALHPVVKSQQKIKAYLASQGQKVDFFDMNAQLQNFEEYEKPDGIHLTVPGLAIFAQKLKPVLRSTYPNYFSEESK